MLAAHDACSIFRCKISAFCGFGQVELPLCAFFLLFLWENSKIMDDNKSFVLTIGRQFGCGAREIGKLVAAELGIDYYDKELLTQAAMSSGVSKELFEAADEQAPQLFSNLWAFGMGAPNGAYYAGGAHDEVYGAQSEVMRQLARRGPCVIVGRCADFLLRDVVPVISVFIHSSMADRIARIIARGDARDEKSARALALKKNKLRANYYNFYTDQQWGDAATYDLAVDASCLGTAGTARLLAAYVRTRLAI